MIHAHLFSFVITCIITTKYKNFTIQFRRARMINFCITIDFEFEIFGHTTLNEIIEEVKVQNLPFGWIRTGGVDDVLE